MKPRAKGRGPFTRLAPNLLSRATSSRLTVQSRAPAQRWRGRTVRRPPRSRRAPSVSPTSRTGGTERARPLASSSSSAAPCRTASRSVAIWTPRAPPRRFSGGRSSAASRCISTRNRGDAGSGSIRRVGNGRGSTRRSCAQVRTPASSASVPSNRNDQSFNPKKAESNTELTSSPPTDHHRQATRRTPTCTRATPYPRARAFARSWASRGCWE